MANPDCSILYAIFESYLNIRTPTWSLDNSNPAHSKLDPVADEKRAICVEALSLFKEAKSTHDWIQVSYELYDLEQCQNKKADKNWYSWFSKQVGYERIPLLAETLCAARAYINSQLLNESEFQKKKNSLAAKVKTTSASIIEKTKNIYTEGAITETRKSVLIDKSKLAENKLKALTESPNYQNSYFNKIIKLHDLKATELNEHTFQDFVSNVKNNSRKNDLCTALIKDLPSKKIPNHQLIGVKIMGVEEKSASTSPTSPNITPFTVTSSVASSRSNPSKQSSNSHHSSKSRSNEKSKRDDIWFVDLESPEDDDSKRYQSYKKL